MYNTLNPDISTPFYFSLLQGSSPLEITESDLYQTETNVNANAYYFTTDYSKDWL
jgi:hypothetical protein